MPRSRRPANVLPFHGRKGWHGRAIPPRKPRRGGWFIPIMVVLPLAAFTAVFTWDGPPPGVAMPLASSRISGDSDRARFGVCSGPVRINCVVDGDTFWYGGEKIRIADINTPEVSDPKCAAEAELGAKATRRLTALLNAGPFTLEPIDRDTDQYGRALRIVTRQGESVGEALVNEGLAERWKGYRGEWC